MDETEICDFGCGRIATHSFKNGRKCCSNSVNRCSAKRLADSQSKKGKSPNFRNGHPRGMKGKAAWNKGQDYFQTYGEDRAEDIKRRLSEAAAINKPTGKGLSEPAEAERRRKISESIKSRYASGWMPKAGRCKKFKYESPIAGSVLLDGTWELTVAEYLDRKKIRWKRNLNRFSYNFEAKDRFYTPDFYLEDMDLYVEVKGYETEKDRSKWNQFPHKLKVLTKKDILLIRTPNGELTF